jgi:hypothetical protein
MIPVIVITVAVTLMVVLVGIWLANGYMFSRRRGSLCAAGVAAAATTAFIAGSLVFFIIGMIVAILLGLVALAAGEN